MIRSHDGLGKLEGFESSKAESSKFEFQNLNDPTKLHHESLKQNQVIISDARWIAFLI